MDNLHVIEVKGQRVLTTKQIAEAYETSTDVVKSNFRYNKKNFVLGKHYIALEGKELQELKRREEFLTFFKQAKCVYLWTEKGALLHAKSINTGKAWEVYDYLVDFYFRVKEAPRQQASELKGVPVVDIPVNAGAQKLIADIRKNITVLDTLLDTMNKYYTEENYQKVAYVVRQQGMSVADQVMQLAMLKPQIIHKIL